MGVKGQRRESDEEEGGKVMEAAAAREGGVESRCRFLERASPTLHL